MKKTGYEIIGMIYDDKAPDKIKYGTIIYYFDSDIYDYKDSTGDEINLLNFLNDEFEIIEDSKIWKPKTYDDFYCIEQDGNVQSIQCYSDKLTENYCEIGNCFKTKEEAQKVVEKIKIYTQLKRYAEEHNTEKIDWTNEKQNKYFISYNEIRDEISIDTSDIQDIVMICFNDYNVCKQAIKEIGEDKIKKLFED